MELKKSHFVIFGLGSAIFTIVALGFYIFNFKNSGLSENPADWGDFGSYLSGTVASILSFVSFIGLLITIYIQNKQQGLSNKALLMNERPWISLELRFGENITIKDSKLLVQVEVTIENHGKTPALNLTFGTRLYNQYGIHLSDSKKFLDTALNGNAENNVSVYLDAVFPSKKETFIVDILLEVNELIKSVKDHAFKDNSFPIYLHVNSYITYRNILNNEMHITSQDGYIQYKDPTGKKGMAIMIQLLNEAPKLKHDKITYTSGMPWHKVYIS